MLLALKLIVVPSLLYALSQSGKWWGQHVAGRLAALPWVAGPILAILALEQGNHFAAQAASMSVASVAASEAFNLGYARNSHRGWQLATLAGLLLWSATATLLTGMGPRLGPAIIVALLASYLNSRLLPPLDKEHASSARRQSSVGLRLLAGASLTLLTSYIAAHAGAQWGGIVAVFPILGCLLAIEIHRYQSISAVNALMHGMSWGRPAFIAFCGLLAVCLVRTSIWQSILIATLGCLTTNELQRRLLR